MRRIKWGKVKCLIKTSKKNHNSTPSAILLFLSVILPCTGQDKPVAWWNFDNNKIKAVIDIASNVTDTIKGNFWFSEGVSGKCLKLDGYTTHVVRAAQKSPVLGRAFTIEAWVAPQTYPWNWTGIVDQEKDHKEGFFFGVSANGNVGLGVATGGEGQWLMCVSRETIELLKWSYIVATYDQSGEIAVYINGKKSGGLSTGEYGWNSTDWVKPPKDVDLWIGRSHTKMCPKGTEREPSRQILSYMNFDGLIDEVKIYNAAMTQEDIKRAYDQIQPKVAKALSFRKFPTEGSNRRIFEADYTTLKYDETWDKLWRIGEFSDIVVTFDKPIRMVFWHGTSYGACYVTENEKWMGDQSLESNELMVNNGDQKLDSYDPKSDNFGCAEHMSDKRCLYSHVSLIENNPARVIVHWRYNPCYITYTQAHVDELTGWGDWADEYFVIYPDAVAVRHQVLWTSRWGVVANTANWPAAGVPWFQFQETIMFNQPGTRPEDNVEDGALSIANMEGQSYTYKWKSSVSNAFIKSEGVVKVPGANIQMTNLKSEYRPFIIFEPGSVIDPWVGDRFYFWNHWPVAQIPSDGRVATAPDRPGHTSFSCGAPIVHDGVGGSHEAVMLYGLINKPIEELVPLARSWNKPPELKVLNGKAKSNGYDKFQRAYVLESENGLSQLDLQLAGSKESPIINPAFVFKGWGQKKVSVMFSKKEPKEGVDYRTGYENHLDGIDLVLWLDLESEKSETISIIPVDK
jgi:hypothetical protein